MTTTHYDFNRTAANEADAPKKDPLPSSLRLTYEERVQLEAEADGKPLGAYIRERLLGDDVAPAHKARQ